MAKRRLIGFWWGAAILVGVVLVSTLAPVFGLDLVALLGEGPLIVLIAALILLGLGLLLGSVLGAVREPLRRYHGEDERTRRLLAIGRPVRARLVSLREDSSSGLVGVNDAPAVVLELRYTYRGLECTASCSTFVPPLLLPRLIPGAEVPILVDPLEPRECLVDWRSF